MAPDNGHRRNWRLYLAALGFSLGIIMIAAVGAWTLVRGQQINKDLCEFADDNREAIVNILMTSRQQALEEAETAEEIYQIDRRVNELLALVPPIRCQVSGEPVELEGVRSSNQLP